MLRYKKLNLKADSDCITEVKTLSGNVYKLAVVENVLKTKRMCFVGNDKDSYVISHTFCSTMIGVSYSSSLKESDYTFIRFLDSADIEQI